MFSSYFVIANLTKLRTFNWLLLRTHNFISKSSELLDIELSVDRINQAK